MSISLERLKSLRDYDPNTGIFKHIKTGAIAGYKTKMGYIGMEIDGVQYYAHRVAWFYMNGSWPKECIDHINGERSDNRMVNLRESSVLDNNRNKKAEFNLCGFRGVTQSGNRWQASISLGGKRVHLGSYATPEEASAAYLIKRAELYLTQPVPREFLDTQGIQPNHGIGKETP